MALGDRDPADVHTLVGAYALDAVDAEERAAVERHLAACEACREEVRGLREAAVRLAEGSAVVPPADLRDRVLAEVARTPQVPAPLGDHDALPDRDRPGPASGQRPPRGWLVAAAVLAAFSLGTGTLAWSQYRSAQDARAAADQVAAVLAAPAARRVEAPLAGGGRATLVVAGDRAVLASSTPRGLPDGRTYQLWIVRAGTATSAGIGPAGPSAARPWSRLVDGVRPGDVVAVSVEPDGGSLRPTSEPVVALRA